MRVAVAQYAKQRQAFENFCAITQAADISQWLAEVEAWEKDESLPNPFQPRTKGWFRLH